MKTFFLFLILLFSGTLIADDAIMIDNPRIKFVPKPSPNSAMFATLNNSGEKDVALVKAESDISSSVELHNMIMEGKEMKMRPIEKFIIKGKGSLELKPGSFHVMFIGLKQALKIGEKKKVTLTFDNGQVITLEVPVEKVMTDKTMMPHKRH